MKLLVCLLLFVLSNHLGQASQPYFPPQLVFSPDNNKTIIAIDEINQRAYLKLDTDPESTDIAYVMQHMPFAKPDSPQAKHYVQLIIVKKNNICSFETYWKYSSNSFGLFPLHWGNDSSYRIKNYMNFNYVMIHSTNSTGSEDYWYTNETCQTDSGKTYRCQEIYFIQNTNIPIRYSEVHLVETDIIRETKNFTIHSIGKPSDKYFGPIPENWFESCRDGDLGVSYNPKEIILKLHESVKVEVWLPAPPHRIHGNDTVTIQWKPFACSGCFTWTPRELAFNRKNFQEKQILTITRVELSGETFLIPNIRGGGYDNVPFYIYTLPIY
ncbi:unnamed protein product [Rotaria sordida]|uniref:Uncharacterized protein n=1 Tax=Rotaria sordida TaxID=392033 RepID=A0A815FUX5_9BILA|nr:unnamed protein product [Rotaria sordida]CAF1438674.1 unnamed protein product [Rotaria sordida]CAF3933988.1 unnamed protein product [Rotaria sordida]